MKTFLRTDRSIAAQVVVPFTGEGAYHGSTKARRGPDPKRAAPPPPVDEMRPTTLADDGTDLADAIEDFDALFPNRWEARTTLPVPSQAAIRDDGVTFCWCPLQQALREAGPLTKEVLERMRSHLRGGKRYVYIDSKIQYFEPGDVPVDSQHWHVDGSITVRGDAAQRRGHGVLHDMKARLTGSAAPPSYLSYQSSEHCATRFVAQPLTVQLPALIPNFDALDRSVRALAPHCEPQPAAAIIRFDGLCLHRAVAATGSGWRLWIRCIETDREVTLTRSIIDCYGTVFRTGPLA